MSNALQTTQKTFDLSPQTFEQALTFAGYLADSDMVPKDFKGKPGNCLIAMQWGMEIGLKPLQAMQNIAVINGRPSLWGDAVIALVRSSPAFESIAEEQTDAMAICRVKRRGEAEQTRTFSREEAKAAGLLGKQGPWSQYPKRMMQMRARAFAIRDVFPDVLKGLAVAEESMDVPKDMGMAEYVSEKPADPPTAAEVSSALPPYPADRFAASYPSWAELVMSGKKTPEQIRVMAVSRFSLTEQQLQEIARLGGQPAQLKAAPRPVQDFQDVQEKPAPAPTPEPAHAEHDEFLAALGGDNEDF